MIMGKLDLNTSSGTVRRTLELQCGVVDTAIPVLISRWSLGRMNAVIHFDKNVLVVGSFGSINLSVSRSGHLILPLILDYTTNAATIKNKMGRYSCSEEKPCAAIGILDDLNIVDIVHNSPKCYPVSEGKTLDLADVHKVRKHLGRANLRQLSCVLRQAGYVVGQESITQMLIKCGCNNSRVRSHASISNAHMSPYPVYAVFMDITYLQKTGHKDPYVMMVDSFSRFLVCVPSPSIKPLDIIRCFEVFWMHWLGRPRFLVRDAGPGLVGNDWNAYARIHNITLICNPTCTPSQMGMLERHVALLKVAIECLQGHDRTMAFEEVVRAGCLARNNSILLGCGMTPAQI